MDEPAGPLSRRPSASDGPQVVEVASSGDLPGVLDRAGLRRSQPVLVLVGGAAGMDGEMLDRLQGLVRTDLAPLLDEHDVAVVDGGTDAGVMRAIGRTRSAAGSRFPLVGVVARGTVALPGASSATDAAAPEPHHTHLLLVPGDSWGDEAPWLATVADVLAGGRPSVTLLVNGGEIAYADVERSLERGRPVIVLAGTGRTADALAAAVAGRKADARATALVQSGPIRVVPFETPDALRSVVAETLGVTSG
ncbi:hypothetical protein ACQP04_29575 [Pseudonocardia halophobica]|uniref:hypothetical protein n=1 Tax=Pseudonocardia halophobica TaxID=29401 RepID=UPI003D8ADF64